MIFISHSAARVFRNAQPAVWSNSRRQSHRGRSPQLFFQPLISSLMQTSFSPLLTSWWSSARCLVALSISLAGLSQPALAQSVPPVRIAQADATSLRLRIDNPAQRPSQLSVVRQASGQVLHSTSYRDAAYGCRLNFSQLPDGLYTIVLKAGPERYRYTVQVQAHGGQVAVREVTTRQTQNLLATAER
jgi:hypothetical protein